MNKFTKRLKRKVRFNSKTNSVVLFLFALVLLLGVGFAYLNVTVSITGAGKVTSSKWDVHFDNIIVNQDSFNSVVEDNIPTIVDNSTITFNIGLDSPGDFYEFSVDIVNDGTIDAMINDIIVTPELTIDQAKLFKYELLYEDGTVVNNFDSLKAGESKRIKILFKYKEVDNIYDYPIDNQSFEFAITINYVQANENAVDKQL